MVPVARAIFLGLQRVGRGALGLVVAHPHACTAIASLIPLAVLCFDATRDRLTANPIQEITLRTGKTGLVLLVAALACTPLNTFFGFRLGLKLRRDLGLFGFLYIALHLMIFAVLDLGLDVQLIMGAVTQKQYVLAGLASFLLLVPLAITSTTGWQRRLGKRWKTLHRLVYVAVPIASLHYLWLVKADVRVPLAYAAIVGLLLLARVPVVRSRLSALGGRLRVSPGSRL